MSISALVTKGGGDQLGKPCPKLVAPVACAIPPKTLQTVSVEEAASLFSLHVSVATYRCAACLHLVEAEMGWKACAYVAQANNAKSPNESLISKRRKRNLIKALGLIMVSEDDARSTGVDYAPNSVCALEPGRQGFVNSIWTKRIPYPLL